MGVLLSHIHLVWGIPSYMGLQLQKLGYMYGILISSIQSLQSCITVHSKAKSYIWRSHIFTALVISTAGYGKCQCVDT